MKRLRQCFVGSVKLELVLGRYIGEADDILGKGSSKSNIK